MDDFQDPLQGVEFKFSDAGGSPEAKFVLPQQVQLDLAQLRFALEHSEEAFIEFFLADEIDFAVPEFHCDVFRRMTDTAVTRFVCAIPRGHAKTTLAKLAVVWHFLFSKTRSIVYLSNTHSVAAAGCRDIAAFFESENFRSVFGEIVFEYKQDGKGNYKFEFEGKTCFLKAMGAGQQVRGLNEDNQRPELAVVDDLEDNDNIASKELFNKLKRWFYGPFVKALDKRNNKVIHLGNMISNQMILKEHCDSEFWNSMRYGCLLTDGTPLWADLWPLEDIIRDFKVYVEAHLTDVWMAEMMNMPIMAGKGLIKPEDINYGVVPEVGEIEHGFITIDPAISKKSWAHECVIAVHGWDALEACWHICEYRAGIGVDPITLYNTVSEMSARWRVNVVGVEGVAYQAALKPVFEFLAMHNQQTHLKFELMEAVGRKVERLAAWAGMVKEGFYRVPEGDFRIVEQLLSYNPVARENNDDIIDCCAYGPQMIMLHLPAIQEAYGAGETLASARTITQIEGTH